MSFSVDRNKVSRGRALKSFLAILSLCLSAAFPSLLHAQSPTIDVFHDQAIGDDLNSDGVVNAGDTIRYTVRLRNQSAVPGHNVHVDLALDPNTSLVPGSLNVQPFAVDDFVVITEDAAPNTVSGNVFLNDAGQDSGETLSVVQFNGSGTPGTLNGDFGTITWSSDGNFTYTLNNNASNVNQLGSGQTVSEAFSYRINDGKGPVSTASVRILVFGANDAPTVMNDDYTTFNNRVITVDAAHGVFANDSDPEGTTLQLVSADTTSSLGSTVSVNTDGSFSFTPTGLSTGQVDSFNYIVRDGTGLQRSGTASLTAKGRIIFVNNNASPPGSGTFSSPYTLLANAFNANQAGDTIYIAHGTGTSTGLDDAYPITVDGISVLGEGVALVLNGTVQIGAGSPPFLRLAVSNPSPSIFPITNASFSIQGVTLDCSVNPAIGLQANQTDSTNRNISVATTTIQNCTKGLVVNATGSGTRNLDVAALTINQSDGPGVQFVHDNNSRGTLTVSGSTFVDATTGITSVASNGAITTANVRSSSFGGIATLGVTAKTQTGAALVLNLNQGNQISGQAIGVSVEQQAGTSLSVNILPNPSPDNDISGNGVGVCNEANAAAVSITPSSQVHTNINDFTSSSCGAG